MHRTHTCNELRATDAGKTVTLSGWVHRRRDLGEMIFISLRDRYGLTQLVIDPKTSAKAHEVAELVRPEWVIKVTGIVEKRMAGQERKEEDTGEIEIKVTEVEVLTKAKTPPFEINNEEKDVAEDLRFKYRYLDLRRRKTLEKIEFRAKMNHFARKWFTAKDFLEVQTPIFTVSSPEGARDYLIPSRVHPGKFYALPQAPQQYKQLLMVGGVDKYFQIAPCFRDEDPRADRHCCEFYQLDVEMSFVEQEDVFNTVEAFLRDLVTTLAPQKRITENSFKEVPYTEAMNLYGSDKPDGRFAMQFTDLTEELKDSGFAVFQNAAKEGTIKAMKLEGQTLSRKEIDELTEVAKKAGAAGLAYLIFAEGEVRSPITKFLSEDEIKLIQNKTEAKDGDMVFFGAGEWKKSVTALGNVRLALRDKFNLVNDDEICCLWVTDFPIFEMSDEGKLDFEHNPFSMPQGGMEALENQDPLTIMGYQYDLAVNGMEMLSGSIRNHDPEVLVKLFDMVGRTEEDVKEKFGGMYNAFQYGAPPHGGFAIGYDRLLMLLFNEDNIRDIYAFPKSTNAQDLMMGAPAMVDDVDLEELGIKVKGE